MDGPSVLCGQVRTSSTNKYERKINVQFKLCNFFHKFVLHTCSDSTFTLNNDAQADLYDTMLSQITNSL